MDFVIPRILCVDCSSKHGQVLAHGKLDAERKIIAEGAALKREEADANSHIHNVQLLECGACLLACSNLLKLRLRNGFMLCMQGVPADWEIIAEYEAQRRRGGAAAAMFNTSA